MFLLGKLLLQEINYRNKFFIGIGNKEILLKNLDERGNLLKVEIILEIFFHIFNHDI